MIWPGIPNTVPSCTRPPGVEAALHGGAVGEAFVGPVSDAERRHKGVEGFVEVDDNGF